MKPLKGRRGFTLIELMIVVMMLAVIVFALYSSMASSTDTFSMEMKAADLESRARQVIDEITGDVISSGTNTFSPTPSPPSGSSFLTFRKATGYSGGSVVWGSPIKYELQVDSSDPTKWMIVKRIDAGLPSEKTSVRAHGVRKYSEGETPNGIDDNGNGLVDELGLSFALVGKTLTVRLTLEGADYKGRVLTRTVESSVRLRN